MTNGVEHLTGVSPSPFKPPAPVPHAQPLGMLQLIAALKRNPLECWTAQHFNEPIVAGGLPLGHVVAVHEPEAIRHILLDNTSNYRKDPFQQRILSAGLADGLLSVEGEHWRAQRRILAPLFSAATVRSFARPMISAAESAIRHWPSGVRGATIDVAAEMTRITLGVLERTIFSDGLGRGANDIRDAMTTYFTTLGRIDPLDLFGVPKFVPRIGKLRVRPVLRFFEQTVDEIIATRRRRLAANPDDAPRDLLTALLKAMDPETGARLTEADVRANILTFISAGHETTANALTWSLYLLSQSPYWCAHVEAEIEREFHGPAPAIADRLVETRAVVEEALRLYPPIAAISRVAIGPDEIGDFQIRRGTLVVISPYVLHRHKMLWDEPNAFDPRRFLGTTRRDIGRFAYLPFGAGPRTCIGSMFALQEAVLVLAVIMKRFAFSLQNGRQVWPMLRVTLRPEGGMPMRVHRKDLCRVA